MAFLDDIVTNFQSCLHSSIFHTTNLSAPPTKKRTGPAQSYGTNSRRRRIYIKKSTKACTASATKRLSPKRSWSTANALTTAPCRSILRKKIISSASRNTPRHIRKKIISDELQIVPATRKHEILSLLDEGLQDVSFSRPRKTDWLGRYSGAGRRFAGDVRVVRCTYATTSPRSVMAGDDELYKEFWPADMHVIGKDILRFHAAIWPAHAALCRHPAP